MQGCQPQARRAEENSPVIDHWVRVALCAKSRPGRKNPRQPGRSRAATKVTQPSRLRVLAPSRYQFPIAMPAPTPTCRRNAQRRLDLQTRRARALETEAEKYANMPYDEAIAKIREELERPGGW